MILSNILTGSSELKYDSFPNYPSSPIPQENTYPNESKINVC